MAEIGDKVLVHYTGTLDDGREFDSSRREGGPTEVTIGEKKLLPLVEKELCDMEPGDRRIIHLSAKQAYGEYDKGLVQVVPADLIPDAEKLPVGGFVELRTRIGALRAKVVSVSENEVILDCNHELAGKAVTFDVELVAYANYSAIERELHPTGCACGCHKLKEQIA